MKRLCYYCHDSVDETKLTKMSLLDLENLTNRCGSSCYSPENDVRLSKTDIYICDRCLTVI